MTDVSQFYGPVADSTAKLELKQPAFQGVSANEGMGALTLKIATIVDVNYARMEATVRIEQGETFQNTPISITFPGAGNRHFFGAMPEVGDACVVGWGARESGKTYKPYIVSWFVPGTTAGYDWWPTQPFAPGEHGMTPQDRVKLRGIADRVRHKLRQMEPGNIVASSSQGADLILNESATLANRRGNELILRDQDQALVVRSVQQFHAMSGARVYGGIVQRNATFLPTQMMSDGVDWASNQQLDTETLLPLSEFDLPESTVESGHLHPAQVFLHDDTGAAVSGLPWPGNVDPYDFLQQGLFVGPTGVVAADADADAVYGGKPIYRVSMQGTNAALDPGAEALTEYRIEVSHSADGTLPVTEETDNFDADRLPDVVPRESAPLNESANAAYVELVMGSVVGNDPFTVKGRAQYGKPLRPVIFDGDQRAGALVWDPKAPISTHSATLLRMTPPIGPSRTPTFYSVLKDGRVMASVAGPGTSWSGELAFGAGLRIGAGRTPGGESLLFQGDGSIRLQAAKGNSKSNNGIELIADTGAVRIFGGGSTTVGGISGREGGVGEGDGDLPGVIVESATNLLLKTAKTLTLQASAVKLKNMAEQEISANSSVTIRSGNLVSVSGDSYDLACMGRATETFGGPKGGNPTNAPNRITKFTATPATGQVPGTVDEYKVTFGNRDETFTAGNHTTMVLVGNQSYECQAGIWKARAVTNTLQLSSAGLQGTMATGVVSLTAAAGAATIHGTASATLSSAGVTLVKGATVTLSSTGGRTGGILCSTDINPITGRPFLADGIGSFTQLLAGV